MGGASGASGSSGFGAKAEALERFLLSGCVLMPPTRAHTTCGRAPTGPAAGSSHATSTAASLSCIDWVYSCATIRGPSDSHETDCWAQFVGPVPCVPRQTPGLANFGGDDSRPTPKGPGHGQAALQLAGLRPCSRARNETGPGGLSHFGSDEILLSLEMSLTWIGRGVMWSSGLGAAKPLTTAAHQRSCDPQP
jgi:hypothetical protein